MKSGIFWVFFGILIIMAAVAFAFYKSMQVSPATQACTLEAKTCPDGTVVGREGPNCEFAACQPVGEEKKATFEWKFEETATDESVGVPQTEVILTFNTQDYYMGTYDGTCSAITASDWTLLEGEQDAALCWFAGGGTEIGVFLEEGRLLVKRGTLEEPTAETEGLRSEFVTIFTLPE